MRILLDVDGVVADSVSYMLDILGISEEKRKKLINWNVLPDMDKEDKKKAIELLSDSDFWRNLPLIDGAKEGVKTLRFLGHDIKWVTSPWSSCLGWEDARKEWLSKNFGGEDPIVFTRDKEEVDGDVFVDDKPENVEKWQRAHPREGHAFLFDTPFNRTFYWPTRVTWKELVRMLAR